MTRFFWDTHTGPHKARKPDEPQPKRRCHICLGRGLAPCAICAGKGEVALGRDHNGRPRFGRCEGCLGNKTRRCTTCNGQGFY